MTWRAVLDRASFDRREWLGVLSRAPLAELESRMRLIERVPPHAWLRRPESGLVMVRGRAGGSGARFNLGEMTVTRCVLRTEDGATGVGCVAGRSSRHAELVALVDALMQRPATRRTVEQLVVSPLRERLQQHAEAMAAKVDATRVRFFTVVRGE